MPEAPKRTFERASLSDVIAFFVKGYKLPPGKTMRLHEFFIDTAKGTVILEVSVEDVPPSLAVVKTP